MIKIFENEIIKFWMEGEDLVYGYYKKDCIITDRIATEIIHKRLLLQNGKICKGLFIISHMGTVTPEAREILSNEGAEGLSRAALVTSSSFNTVMGNIFIQINKPKIPIKLFKTQEDGLKWLKKDPIL
jgi:hypothetical protein